MVGATRIVVVQEQAGNDALGGGDNYESQEIEFISATRAALGADTAFVIGLLNIEWNQGSATSRDKVR